MITNLLETIKKTVTDFLISEDSTIKIALEKISKNNHGIIFIQDELKQVIGCVTDGDIRTFLLKSNNDNILNCSIKDCINTNFVSIQLENVTHEYLLKTLDSHIKVIPILNNQNHLVDIATKNNLPQFNKKKTTIRSKSPVRISFSGGGTDISSFFTKHSGAVLNATINLFAHATLIIRNDSCIKLHSLDLNIKEEFKSIHDIHSTDQLTLIKSAIDVLNPSFGFELITRSDVPVGSGLGGSAVLLSAVIGAFDMFNGGNLDQYEIAQLAYQTERINSNIEGGWQDQYATVFGGFNYIELNQNDNIVYPLRIADSTLHELEECLLLCFSGQTRNSNTIHSEQKSRLKLNENYAQEMMGITLKMKQKLLKNKLTDFGKLLHESWELKKKFSTKISSPLINEIYEHARKNGALGGKILGAGGGGYFLFFVPPKNRENVILALKHYELSAERFQFVNNGLRVWKADYEN
jgi:D-glycero-alpha-D-manno-heptose-7-phosphate kinase